MLRVGSQRAAIAMRRGHVIRLFWRRDDPQSGAWGGARKEDSDFIDPICLVAA
jgi:hypothetical protein